MRVAFIVMFFLIMGCVNKEKIYVQKQEIRLAQPRVFVTNTIIDSSVIVTADLRLNGVKIFYTKDGTNPTQESLLYEQPLTIQKKGVYTFKAFHPDWKPSEPVSLTLFKKGVVPAKINWLTNAHPSYPDEDTLSLINQKKGALHFRDVEWTGFDSVAKATVYFKEKTYINSITIGFLIDTKSWIFPPEEITVYLNKKDSIYTEAIPYIKSDLKEIESVRIPVAQKLNSITIAIKNLQELPKWHSGKGNKAWLFLDEFIFNE